MKHKPRIDIISACLIDLTSIQQRYSEAWELKEIKAAVEVLIRVVRSLHAEAVEQAEKAKDGS